MESPYSWREQNYYVTRHWPSTVHTRDNTTEYYFRKYLLQRAMSPFKFTLPDNWPLGYFLYILYVYGKVGVINTDKYGVIPQYCTLYGYNVFYLPTGINLNNPLIITTNPIPLETQASLIHLMPDYSSIMDIIYYFADKLALMWKSFDINILNSELAYIYPADNDAIAESFKRMFDQVQEGNPAVVVGKDLFDKETGQLKGSMLNQHLKNTYIADDILCDINKIIGMFDKEIGIPTANTDKRERLISDEVNAGNADAHSKLEVWYDTLTESIDKTRKLFNISENNLNVKWRYDNATVRNNDTRDILRRPTDI